MTFSLIPSIMVRGGCFRPLRSYSSTVPAFASLKSTSRHQQQYHYDLHNPNFRVSRKADDTRLLSSSCEEQPRALALEAFSVLARQGRSWRRLGHLVDMAVTDYYGRDDIRTIADVGTDHGLLAMGLALSERFDKVVGVDVSQRALQDGALSLLENVQKYNYLEEQKKNKAKGLLEIPIEFRLSNGLENVDQADAVCIAGMGVHTMLRILESSFSSTEEGMLLDVDRIGCQKLLLQPTNSRPRHLILLYDTLQESGWCLVDERIEKLSSRWYISSCFMRSNRHRQEDEDEVALPFSKLSSTLGESNSSSMRQVFEEYLQHHLNWIHQDAKAGGGATNEADQRWLARFGE